MKILLITFNKIIIPLVAGLLICCSSCNHYYYAPNDAYLMSLTEKGDVKTSISLGGLNSSINNSDRRSFNIQAGFSPINRLGIQGSYFNISESESTQNSAPFQSGNGQVGEFAIGTYYNKLGTSDVQNKIYVVYDFYAGMGWGDVHNNYSTGARSSISFQKYFVQTGVHLHVQKNFSTSFGLMFGSLNYQKATIFGSPPESENEIINTIDDKEPFFMWAPSLRMQFGMEQAKLFLSVKSIHIPQSNPFEYLNSFIQFGVLIEPDEFFRKERSKKKEF